MHFGIAKGLKHHTCIHCDLVHQLCTSVLVDLYILLSTSEEEENSACMMSTYVYDLNDLVNDASDSLDIWRMLEQLGSCFYESDRCSGIAITRFEREITRAMTLYGTHLITTDRDIDEISEVLAWARLLFDFTAATEDASGGTGEDGVAVVV
jgi:hypothetical protein